MQPYHQRGMGASARAIVLPSLTAVLILLASLSNAEFLAYDGHYMVHEPTVNPATMYTQDVSTIGCRIGENGQRLCFSRGPAPLNGLHPKSVEVSYIAPNFGIEDVVSVQSDKIADVVDVAVKDHVEPIVEKIDYLYDVWSLSVFKLLLALFCGLEFCWVRICRGTCSVMGLVRKYTVSLLLLIVMCSTSIVSYERIALIPRIYVLFSCAAISNVMWLDYVTGTGTSLVTCCMAINARVIKIPSRLQRVGGEADATFAKTCRPGAK